MEEPKALFTFGKESERVEVMRLTRDGFIYNGETIKDAGVAYNLLIKFLIHAENSGHAISIIQRLHAIAAEAIGEEELQRKLADLPERVH